MRAATAQNINNMNMGPILRHTTLFPPHPGIECSPWKRVNSANISLQNLYYEISCYFRNGQNFHISTYSYHSVPLPKFTLGYRLQLLITFLTIFKRYIGIFWKIRKALSNPNLPLKPGMFFSFTTRSFFQNKTEFTDHFISYTGKFIWRHITKNAAERRAASGDAESKHWLPFPAL